MNVARWKDSKWKIVGDGIRMKVLAYGGNLMITIVEFEKGASAPVHSHPHEQISHILEGRFVYRIDGEESILEEGDSVYVPPNAEHNVTALEKGRILDVFTPIRRDFL